MKRNTAGQSVPVNMLNTDGTPFTGAASVFVTKGNGAQAAGAGTVSHKGNGHHVYLPTQAETDADQVSFSFVGVGAANAGAHYEPETHNATTGLRSVDVGGIEGADPTDQIAAAGVAALATYGAAVVSQFPGNMADLAIAATGEVYPDSDALRASLGLASGGLDATLAALLTNILAIKDVSDLIPDAGAMSSIAQEASVAAVTAAIATLTSTLNATRYAKNITSQKVFFVLTDNTDHVQREPGISVTAQRSLDGGAWATCTGTVVEVGNGLYYLNTSAADINADDAVYRFTGVGVDPVEVHVVTY